MSDTRKSNAPIGMTRSELVMVTKDHEIKLSGSPIEQDLHQDYRTGDHRTSLTEAHGIAGIYNHTDGGYETQGDISSVSDDGFTITLDGTDGVDAGDLVEVIYYSSPRGTSDHLTASQIGDALTPETLDAAVQKINDCPPLDTKLAGLTFDRKLCSHTESTLATETRTLAKYAATQVGTWQTSDTPFYVTGIHIAWDGDSVTTSSHADIYIYVDGVGTGYQVEPFTRQRLLQPCGLTDKQGVYLWLGHIECESDFKVTITVAGAFTPTNVYIRISGWHL